MVKNLTFLILGLGFSLRFWEAQPEAPLRYMALAISNVWLGVAVFYAVPLVVSYLASRICCRWREGAWWVIGNILAMLGLAAHFWPVYLSCPLFGSCATGNAFWVAATAVLPSAVGKALALSRFVRSGSVQRRSLTRDLASQLARLRTPHGAIASLTVLVCCCTCLYLNRPVPPQLSPQDLRYTVGGVCAGMTRDQVEMRAGVGVPDAAIAPALEPRCYKYPWGELLYTEDGWVAWAHGSPLMVDGRAVVHQGDNIEEVIDVLGTPGRRERFDRTVSLVWPSRSLSVQLLDGRVQFCTLRLRQNAISNAGRG